MAEHFIFFAAILAVNAVYDGMRWRNGDYIPQSGHFNRAMIRGVLWMFNAAWWIEFEPYRSIEILPLLSVQAFAFWLVFDIAVNVIAGKRAFHLGQTSLFDRLFWIISSYHYTPAIVLQYACKLAGMVGSVIWYNYI